MAAYGDLKKCATGGFFELSEVLSYNKPYNFIIGARSTGKSTAAAIFAVLDYVQQKRQFMYVRRTKDELQVTAADFCTSALDIIRDKLGKAYNIEYKGGVYYITGDGIDGAEICGYTMPLSLQHKYKSSNFQNVDTIIFDEFLCDARQGQRYLGGGAVPDMEPHSFLSLYGTVARGVGHAHREGVRAIFLGNASDLAASPFFLYYGIYDMMERSPEARIISPKNALWLLCKARAQVTASMEVSNMRKLAAGSDVAYIFGDAGTDDRNFVVAECPECQKTFVNLIISGRSYMVKRSEGFEKLYATRGRDPYARAISCDLLGHDGKRDFAMIKAWHELPALSVISDCFKRGNLYFDTVRTKLDFLSYLKYI